MNTEIRNCLFSLLRHTKAVKITIKAFLYANYEMFGEILQKPLNALGIIITFAKFRLPVGKHKTTRVREKKNTISITFLPLPSRCNVTTN